MKTIYKYTSGLPQQGMYSTTLFGVSNNYTQTIVVTDHSNCRASQTFLTFLVTSS